MGGLRGVPRVGLAIVGLHYAANLAHGVAHEGVPVALTTGQAAFVVLVVAAAPLGSLWLLRSGRPGLGWATLAVVLLASFLFGVGFHYVVDSADHVANVPEGHWHGPFVWTAALVALIDGAGALVAVRFAHRS